MEHQQENIQQNQEVSNQSTSNESYKAPKWGASPKAKEIIENASRSNQIESNSNQNDNVDHNEALDHHLESSGEQDNISEYSNKENIDAISDGHASGEDINEPEVIPSDDQDSQDKKTGIPQWGRDNPERWGKYKARQKEKEYEAKMKEKDAQIEQFQKMMQSYSQNNQQQHQQQRNENIIYDPKTGMPVDTTTPEGELVAREIILEAQRNQYRNQIAYNEYQELRRRQENILEKKLEEAKFKYNDYEDVVFSNSGKFTQQMIDVATIMTDNDPNNQINGSDFLYYLCKNKNEFNRISTLNPFEQYSILMKHAINFASKSPKVSKAPEPIKPLPKGSQVSSGNFGSYESAKAYMKKKYCR